MQLAKINGGGPGWRRKMKIAIIYQLMVGKLMLVAPHFVSVVINLYSNAGKKDLLKHATKSTEQLSRQNNYLSTTLLPLHWRKPTRDSSTEISTCNPLASECTMPDGVAGIFHTTAVCPSLKENTSCPIISVSDCTHHFEANRVFPSFCLEMKRPYLNFE